MEYVDYEKAKADIHLVRDTVFIREQGIPEMLEYDGLDPGCEHVLARDENERPIGTGRIQKDGHLGRLAVLKPWRRRGIGKSIMKALLSRARESGMKEVFLDAQAEAVPFYEGLGFEPEGEPFYEANILHVKMIKTLASQETGDVHPDGSNLVGE